MSGCLRLLGKTYNEQTEAGDGNVRACGKPEQVYVFVSTSPFTEDDVGNGGYAL